MKQCPNCKTTYTDESLKFCLADGAKLESLSNAEKTVAMNRENANQMRVDLHDDDAPDSIPTAIIPPQQQQNSRKGVSSSIVAVLVGLLLLVIIGFAGFAAYTFMDKDENSGAASPTPNASPTPDNDEINLLKEELANVKKQINAKKDMPLTKRTPVDTMPKPLIAGTPARVNSPGDGFLALRTAPNTKTGERIVKIPHGVIVNIVGCRGIVTGKKKRGRWCQVEYNGQKGWAFDAYLVR